MEDKREDDIVIERLSTVDEILLERVDSILRQRLKRVRELQSV